MRRLLADAERGSILPVVVAALFFLLGMAAFAIDIGWLWLNGSRIQNAADNASTAGVALMPLAPGEPLPGSDAFNRALEMAAANDYPNSGSSSVTPMLTSKETELRVEISDTVPTFFMRLFGLDSVRMKRYAVAENIPPVQLGSDQPTMGNDPFAPGGDVGYWVAINGEYTAKAQGDPFSTRCVVPAGVVPAPNTMNSNPLGDGSNCDFRNEGLDFDPTPYHYAVEVPAGAAGNLQFDIYDAPFFNQAGDSSPLSTGEFAWDTAMTTTFSLYGPDDTPNDPTDNTDLRCRGVFVPDPEDPAALVPNPFGGPDLPQPAYVAQFKQTWTRLCTTASSPGIFVLRVTVDQGSASNSFSFRAAVGGGVTPAVYGLGRMSLFASDANSSSRFQVARVTPAYAGKRMIVTLYDPGEVATGTAVMRFVGEAAGIPCEVRVRDWRGVELTGWQLTSPCDIVTSLGGALYNAQFLDIRFSIPDDYTCQTDCWFRVNYDLSAGGGATDRTTWTAIIDGNPIHLVE